MKIAIVCFNLKWQAGGARLIFSLAHGLMDLGHRVFIYTPEFDEGVFPDLRKGLDIRVVPQARSFDWTENPPSFIGKIFHKIREERFHVAVAKNIALSIDRDFEVVNLHDFAYKVGFFYKKINHRAKIVWTENDPPFSHLPKKGVIRNAASRIFNSIKEYSERKYLNAMDSVVVLDFYNRNWAARRGLHPVVVRSGVDFETFYSPVKHISAHQKSIRILGIGALNVYRRFEDIIGAVKLLRSWGYDARALIVCKDIWRQKEYRAYLEQLVVKEKLDDCVTFKFEGVSHEELKIAYRESDVFVLPIYLPSPRNGYGWGLSNFEAMAAGLPLVICNTSTAMEVLRDGEHALAVRPMDPGDIAQKVKMLMDDPVLYRRITEQGQRFVREHISWVNYCKEMVNIFTR